MAIIGEYMGVSAFHLHVSSVGAQIAETALVEGAEIGDGTQVWHFAHISNGAKIGKNCNIGERVYVGKGVIIGNNVHVANGANIYEGAIIQNNVFIGNNVSFTNVKYPRAWRKAWGYVKTVVGENVTINANAVITGGVTIGDASTIGEGAIVVRDVSPGGFVVSPAAQCICDRKTCKECILRKERNIKRGKQHYGTGTESA